MRKRDLKFCLRESAEVDVFSGSNQGLILAEIELTSEDERFQKPEWIGQEVSQDARYFNVNLQKYPFRSGKISKECAFFVKLI